MTTKALTAVGATRINKQDISKTLDAFSYVSNIPKHKLVTLGSVGKQSTSGDIDVALSYFEFDPIQIHEQLIQHYTGTFNKGNNIGSYLVPKPDGEFVQLDLMFVPDVMWAQFAYFSAGDASDYKGAVRTILLMGIAAAHTDERFTKFEYDGDLLTFRCGLTFDLNLGLRSIIQYRKSKPNGDFNSTLTKVEFDEAQRLFPSKLNKIKRFHIANPRLVLCILFGHRVRPNEVETAEQVIELIKSTFDEEHQQQIFKFASQRAMGIKDKTTLPPEISNFY
jgi:hypothetical protein